MVTLFCGEEDNMLFQTNFGVIIQKLLFFTLVNVALFSLCQSCIGKATFGGKEEVADGAHISGVHNHQKGNLHDATYDHKAILGKRMVYFFNMRIIEIFLFFGQCKFL